MGKVYKTKVNRQHMMKQMHIGKTKANTMYGVVKSSHSRGSKSRRSTNDQLNTSETFFTFILADNQNHRWQFPSFSDNSEIGCYSSMHQKFPKISEEMGQIWKRVALDHALEFDELVDPATLRVLCIKVDVQDVTRQLFESDAEYIHNRKMASIGRLSDEEAKLLGLEKERTIYKISTDAERTAEDNKILRKLDDQGEEVNGIVGKLK